LETVRYKSERWMKTRATRCVTAEPVANKRGRSVMQMLNSHVNLYSASV